MQLFSYLIKNISHIYPDLFIIIQQRTILKQQVKANTTYNMQLKMIHTHDKG